jgi:hypothetical protein
MSLVVTEDPRVSDVCFALHRDIENCLLLVFMFGSFDNNLEIECSSFLWTSLQACPEAVESIVHGNTVLNYLDQRVLT